MSEYYVIERLADDGSGELEYVVVGNGETKGTFTSEFYAYELCIELNAELEQQNKPKPKSHSPGMR